MEEAEAEINIQGLEKSETKEDSRDVEKKKTSASSDPNVSADSNSVNNVTNESERIGIITENNVQLVREAYLESVYHKAPTEGFYCPNCKTCIHKVLILDTEREETIQGIHKVLILATEREEIIQDIPENTTLQEDNKRLEILKCIVYGGLIESIASLIVVISAASVDATAVNILALSAANLLGGSLILDLHMKDMKSEQPRGNNETNESEDRYYKVLGKRENYYLHILIVMLSSIIFGLMPPLVYGFFFYMSNNNKDVTVVAVSGASAICITLLSIAKAYIHSPNTYLKTVLYYLYTAFLGSILSNFYGGFVKGFLENHGWFGSQSSSFTLLVPHMITDEKLIFGSY